MPWFAPVIKKNSSSSSTSYQITNHQESNPPPPPSSVARKIKEQGWYNSIRVKPTSNQSNSTTTSNYISTSSSIAVADSPSLSRQTPSTHSNSNLNFFKSPKKNQLSNLTSSRRPRIEDSNSLHQNEEEQEEEEFDSLYSDSTKLNSLDQTNVKHHNETITILNHSTELHHHESNPISNSISNSISNPIRATSSKMTNSLNFLNQSHPSTLSNQHHLQSRTNQIHEIEIATQSLAIRLQELATANQDGLLDDEEYRILRQALFDKMTSKNHEPSVIDIGSVQIENFPSTNSNLTHHQTHSHQTSPQSNFSGLVPTSLSPTRDPPSIRRSLRSTNSSTSFIQSLFKRQPRWRRSKANLEDEDQPYEESDVESNSPSLPIDAAPPLLTRALHHRPELHRQASRSSHPTSWNGSQPSTTGSKSFASGSADSETSRSTITRPKTLIRTSSSYSKSSRMLTGTTMTTTVVATTDQDHTSATVMRREISDLEYERGRVLETFDEMERAAIAKWKGTEQSQETGESIGRDRPTSFLAPLPSAASLRNGPKHRRQRGNTIVKSPPPPSSSSSSSVVVSNHFETIGGSSVGIHNQSNGNFELEKELEEIRRKRKAVEIRYGDRLEYLNAKLKGAMIRERSKG